LQYGRKKILIGICLIIAAVVFLGYQGLNESKSYYLFVDEVLTMGEQAKNIKIKIHGSVVPGTIKKEKEGMYFDIAHNQKQISVHYTGNKPVPDSFREGAPVIIDGKINQDGVFEGSSIQAKCASKYEAEYNKIKTTP
jgi:cytochrome c-type biogenesis protein CcmE